MPAHIVQRRVADRVAELETEPLKSSIHRVGFTPIVTQGISVDANGYVVCFIAIDWKRDVGPDRHMEVLGQYSMRDEEICHRDAIAVASTLKLPLRRATSDEGWKEVTVP